MNTKGKELPQGNISTDISIRIYRDVNKHMQIFPHSIWNHMQAHARKDEDKGAQTAHN